MPSMPTMQAVNSSQVTEVGYDDTAAALYVRFTSGALYRYDAVPQSIYQALITSPSFGSYMNSHVKRSYTYERIE